MISKVILCATTFIFVGVCLVSVYCLSSFNTRASDLLAFSDLQSYARWNDPPSSRTKEIRFEERDAPTTLGFDAVYLVHLAARRDRAARMKSLTEALNINATNSDAIGAKDAVVKQILRHVEEERVSEGWCPRRNGCKKGAGARGNLFAEDAYRLQQNPSAEALGLSGADNWLQRISSAYETKANTNIPSIASTSMRHILIDRKNGFTRTLDQYNQRTFFPESTTDYKAVSPAAIACWHSHVSTLRQFIDSGRESALILEDDVDMEKDIQQRMEKVHQALPNDWDLLFLGHCWGREDFFEPVNTSLPELRPSFAPKCNHAYAVSRNGALRLMRHLRSPAFAYSRPLDQAIVQLIATDRVKSYSLFPSIVAQTKDTQSDIFAGTGSRWRDVLEKSTLEELGLLQRRRN